MPTQVFIVDDHPLVREGVTRKIDAQPDMQVVAVAATGEEALKLFEQRTEELRKEIEEHKQTEAEMSRAKEVAENAALNGRGV